MKHRTLVAAACMLFASSALASSISTFPMRVELEEGTSVGNLTVMNGDDKPVNVQVRAMKWTQDEKTGAEHQEETKELVFFPKIFTIPAKGEMVIRVGYQGAVGDHEKSYRLLVRELPVDEEGQTGARFAMQISSPAFIYAKGAVQLTKPQVQGIEVSDGVLMARVTNDSPRYYSMHKLILSGSKGGKEVYSGEVAGWYVLSGVSKLFPLKISRKDCMKMDSLHLTAHTKDDKSEASFPVDAALCGKIADSDKAAKQ